MNKRSRTTSGSRGFDPAPRADGRRPAGRFGRGAKAVASIAAAALLIGCATRGGSSEASNTTMASQPDRAAALVSSAESAIRAGDKQQAIAELTRAIEINPTLTKAHMTLADVHRSEGDFASAESSYRRAAELEPRNFDAQYYDGLMLHLLNRLSEAVRAYLRALSIRPNDFQANLRLAGAYYQLDELPQALEYSQRSTKLDPRSGEARYQLGAVYAAMDDHAAAVREYQQATEAMELTPELLLNLAESLGRVEKFTEMVNTLQEAIRRQPTAAAWERLGFAHWRQEHYEQAHTDFEEALRLDPDYFPALNGMGVSWLRRWRETDEQDSRARDEGIAYLRRSLLVKRDQPKVLELLTRYGN
ncbi:MAG: tetratricopeptide repeat protein [Phycisphaerales bacterium]